MRILSLPWLDAAVILPLVGSLVVARWRDTQRAFRWGIALTGTTLAFTILAAVDARQVGSDSAMHQGVLPPQLFRVDPLNAPLIVTVALLHFLTTVATPRTRMRSFALSWSLASESIRILTFACRDPWLLIALIVAGTFTPFVELRNRGRPTRIYLIHMALLTGLLVLGWAWVDPSAGRSWLAAWATVPLLLAVLVRCGAVPAHLWLTDWFEQASFGGAMLFVAPLTGVYVAVRLVLPIAPDWVLQSIGIVSLITAVYAAAMALIQSDLRRFVAFFFLSHSSLVLVGLELHTPVTLTACLCLWITVALSLGGFGLTMRALEARVGRLSLSQYHGLYDLSPMLAACFLLTGLASIGFPGTVCFVATEMLIEGAVGTHLTIGLAVIVAMALNGMAVIRVYFLLFTGRRHASAIQLDITPRERFAMLTLTGLIIGGGLYPEPGVVNRFSAAQELLQQRETSTAAQPVAARP
jgi:NADH-quinone oxidoreductase subunit M